MGRLQTMMESGDINEMMNDPASLLDGINVPEESDATRAINAATSVLLAFFCAAAQDITETLLGPRPALVEAYARHRRSDARGEDAAAALFGITTQGPHHDAATAFVATLVAEHSLSVFGALLRVDGLPSASEPLHEQVLTLGVAIDALAVAAKLRVVGRQEPQARVHPVHEGLDLLFVAKDHATLPVRRHRAEVDDLDVTDRIDDLGDFTCRNLAHETP